MSIMESLSRIRSTDWASTRTERITAMWDTGKMGRKRVSLNCVRATMSKTSTLSDSKHKNKKSLKKVNQGCSNIYDTICNKVKQLLRDI